MIWMLSSIDQGDKLMSKGFFYYHRGQVFTWVARNLAKELVTLN